MLAVKTSRASPVILETRVSPLTVAAVLRRFIRTAIV
jgi:hypothetical protein